MSPWIKPCPTTTTSRWKRCWPNMPDTGRFAQAAAVFQQVSDGSRLRIFWFLCHCEECVSDIAAAMGMSSAAVSHHLKSLRMHGLITSRRVGKEMHYTLADTGRPNCSTGSSRIIWR